MGFATIEKALEVIATGGMVIVVDDESRENEGDVVMAAEFATTQALTFMVSRCLNALLGAWNYR
jgi:3,4-dihydroxy 2-butanone 4-phosphate synthase/GTP cyclohydrolase II